MKTREEFEELKRRWRDDPSLDIENTEGFGEYAEELLQFRRYVVGLREKRERETARREDRCEQLNIPGNHALLTYIESLERRIDELEAY